jgi:hypothetical protein
LVFGITLGFVYHHRFQSCSRAQTISRMRVRSSIVLLCAVLICIPELVGTWSQTSAGPARWLWATYSVLVYYVLALYSAPAWLAMLGSHPFRNALLLGVAHWLLAAFTLAVWERDQAQGVTEFVRFILVSGPYAYLPLVGCTLIAIPVGVYLRRTLHNGTLLPFMAMLLFVGSGLMIAGYLIGTWTKEFELHAIVSGTVKAPPRVWYWMFFAGPALIGLVLLVWIEVYLPHSQRWLYPISLFGQGALPIYTAHAFVLPLLAVFDAIVVIEGLARVIVPLVIFGVFCGMVSLHHHNKRRLKIAAVVGPETFTPEVSAIGAHIPGMRGEGAGDIP